jgi:RND family efflux transporter MFP subunit
MAANGYVVAARRAALSADTPGRIVALEVTEGTVVKQGEVVARLYADEFEAALRRAEADVTAARAGVTQAEAEVQRQRDAAKAALHGVARAKAELALAQQERERVDRLIATKVATDRERDQARSTLDAATAAHLQAEALERAAQGALASAQAGVELAKARQQVAEANREQAAATLEKTYVRAPFDGVVVLKDAEVGAVVSPKAQGGSNSRGSVATMVDFASLEVQADVPETSLAGVTVGAPAKIFLDAYPETPYAGRVDRVWPTANRQKATVEVRVAFVERDERLRPEMGVRVVFLAGEQPADDGAAAAKPAILVPEDALVRMDGKEGVFVLERDVVQFRELGLGERRGGRLEVLRGLAPGERIVAAPSPSLSDGARVRVKEGA